MSDTNVTSSSATTATGNNESCLSSTTTTTGNNKSCWRKYFLHEDIQSCEQVGECLTLPSVLLMVFYIFTIISFIIRYLNSHDGFIEYCLQPMKVLAGCQIALYILLIFFGFLKVYKNIFTFKESFVFCGLPYFLLLVVNIIEADEVRGCQYLQVLIDCFGYFALFLLWCGETREVSGFICVFLHVALMIIIIVLSDHTNSEVLQFLIGLAEEILLFELLHHAYDSFCLHKSAHETSQNKALTPNEAYNPVCSSDDKGSNENENEAIRVLHQP